MSVSKLAAQYYWIDARDFADRFDLLWEAQLHKTGRIKTFVDLFMGCECLLKCHIFLANEGCPSVEIYRKFRTKNKGHEIEHLAALATLFKDRSDIEFISIRLKQFSVLVRYSLDSYAAFFPALIERKNLKISYSETIGDNAWVLEIRTALRRLIQVTSLEFTGVVNDSIEDILKCEEEMDEFMAVIAPRINPKPRPL